MSWKLWRNSTIKSIPVLFTLKNLLFWYFQLYTYIFFVLFSGNIVLNILVKRFYKTDPIVLLHLRLWRFFKEQLIFFCKLIEDQNSNKAEFSNFYTRPWNCGKWGELEAKNCVLGVYFKTSSIFYYNLYDYLVFLLRICE